MCMDDLVTLVCCRCWRRVVSRIILASLFRRCGCTSSCHLSKADAVGFVGSAISFVFGIGFLEDIHLSLDDIVDKCRLFGRSGNRFILSLP